MPLIGITTHPAASPDGAELDLLLDDIVGAVERAGGQPVLLPVGLQPATLRGLYSRLDGLLLSGGGDLDPACYGAGPHPSVSGVDPRRDKAELALARWAALEDKPFFGICRGAQVLNVALGGTLYRDLGEHPGALQHTFDWPAHPHDRRAHPVQVAEASRLASILGLPVLEVNSLHHQACRDLAPGLQAVARAPDGLVEALELPGRRFALAVQWHPECFPHAPEMRALFSHFVRAAGTPTPSASP